MNYARDLRIVHNACRIGAFRMAAVAVIRIDRMLALCPDCRARIGGACAGPDMDWRPALAGEPCGAADHA